ncbi:hypothetical protein NCG89_11675 [Spongiibacter taiwanensis]|uniref:hypothetical protein n=1 Tax=Spongiibacter taiwanensis TaxID=1748242 RepID=UPI0020363FFF|nr:hypothetical protein [Spongiibacter taiwanensis]USA42180.1 hypothetical protein NCG89_11675 [Spongiibacter taiwanensis]
MRFSAKHPLIIAAICLAAAAALYLIGREIWIYRSAVGQIETELLARANTATASATDPTLRDDFLEELADCTDQGMRGTMQEVGRYLGGVNRAVKTGNDQVLMEVATVLLYKCIQNYVLTAETVADMAARNALFGDQAVFPVDSQQWAKDWMAR